MANIAPIDVAPNTVLGKLTRIGKAVRFSAYAKPAGEISWRGKLIPVDFAQMAVRAKAG